MKAQIEDEAKSRSALPEETPNALTAETLRRSEQGKDLHKADTIDGLFRKLGIQRNASDRS